MLVIGALLQGSQAQVFDTEDIDIEDCDSGTCATLYFVNEREEEIHSEIGTVGRIRKIGGKWGVRNAAFVRQVGGGGCSVSDWASLPGGRRLLQDLQQSKLARGAAPAEGHGET